MTDAQLATAEAEARSLLRAMFPPDKYPTFEPLADVAGQITQINNGVAGLCAQLAAAREALEAIVDGAADALHHDPETQLDAILARATAALAAIGKGA